MNKRPAVNLDSLLSGESAKPMSGAMQRGFPSDELESLAFKVPPEFRKRFRSRALEADLKLNELLFAALDAWESKNI